MKTIKVREWKDLKYSEKRITMNELFNSNYPQTFTEKKCLIADLRKYCFDECGQKIFVFNSIIGG